MGSDLRPIRFLILESSIEACASLHASFIPENTDELSKLASDLFAVTDRVRGNNDIEFDTVGSVEKACRAVREGVAAQKPFSVVVLEFSQEGERNGLEVAEYLWRVDPHLQFVILANDRELGDQNRFIGLPSKDQLVFLRKPVLPLEIAQAFRVLVDKWLLAAQMHSHVWRLQKELDRRIEQEAQLRQKAEFDALTRLPNRTALLSRLQSVLGRNREKIKTIDAILFLDLDNFKPINDSLGHRAGDELLNQVAYRLRSCVRTRVSGEDSLVPRSTGEVARLGGDEFVVLLERLRKQSDSAFVAERIIDRLGDPFSLSGREVRIGTSIGIAFADDGSLTPEQWLHNADAAMYRAKLSGKNKFSLYDRHLHSAIATQRDLESSLKDAISREEFDVYYQPIYNLKTRRLYGVEALLRWKLDGGTPVPPSKFIPMAEQLGLINDLGYWTIAQATSQIQAFSKRNAGMLCESLKLTVNLSKSQLGDPQFTSRVEEILAETKFRPDDLKLEITEGLLTKDRHDILTRLALLQQRGFGTWLDDFGVGNLSLAFFHQLNVEAVKIDHGFVQNLDKKQAHQAIVRAVLQLAHSLDAKVVAEGLETIEQVQFLTELGCDYGQGYYFCPPVPLGDIQLQLEVPLGITKERFTAGLPSQVLAPTSHLSSMNQDNPV